MQHPENIEAETAPVKYIYLDIVGFTQNRSVEAQAYIIEVMNTIVSGEVVKAGISPGDLLFLPTGDGLCVALLNVEHLFDVHMRIGKGILAAACHHNEKTKDPMRKLEMRIGINSNVDNIITDITGRKNVAGTGINFAQRVMSMADAGQILVGQTVFETLRNRENYMNAFTLFQAKAKHDTSLPVYQFVAPNQPGLNTNTPIMFIKNEEQPQRLTKVVAYYFAHAIRNREFLMSQVDRPYASFVSTMLLWSLATDSIGFSEGTEINPYKARTWGAGRLGINEQFEYFSKQDSWAIALLGRFINETHLRGYAKYFDNDQGTWVGIFVNHEGTRKLRDEWPRIWADFEFQFYEA